MEECKCKKKKWLKKTALIVWIITGIIISTSTILNYFNVSYTPPTDTKWTNLEYILENEAKVTIGEYKTYKDDDVEYDAPVGSVTITIKNMSNERRHFSFDIEAINDKGERIGTEYFSVDGLGGRANGKSKNL